MSTAGTAPNQPASTGIREVLKIPAFRRLWLAQMVSIFGDFLALYAIYAAVSFRLHGSARQVTLITVFFLLPLALISPIAGVFVDRWHPKRTMVTSDLIRTGLALLLILCTNPWQIYAVLFAISTFSSFFVPAQSVTTPLLVPRESLISASAAMQQLFSLIRIASPAVAGALVGAFGEASCYYIDSASFLFSAVMIAGIAIPIARPHAEKQIGSVLNELFSGTKFIVGHPVIGFVILSIAAGMFAISSFSALLAVYVRDVLHSNTYMFGALGSMVGVGMLLCSLVIGKLTKLVRHQAYLVSIGMFAIGVFILVLSWLGNAVATLGSCLAIGFGSGLIIIPAGALMQSEIPHEMRGRVSSSSMSLITLAQGVSMLFAGDLAARFGILTVYYGSAVLLFVIGVFGHFRLKRIG